MHYKSQASEEYKGKKLAKPVSGHDSICTFQFYSKRHRVLASSAWILFRFYSLLQTFPAMSVRTSTTTTDCVREREMHKEELLLATTYYESLCSLLNYRCFHVHVINFHFQSVDVESRQLQWYRCGIENWLLKLSLSKEMHTLCYHFHLRVRKIE